MYTFKTLCPVCKAGVRFESKHNWYRGATLKCPACAYTWIEKELIGKAEPGSETEKRDLYERGRRMLDDIVIPD